MYLGDVELSASLIAAYLFGIMFHAVHLDSPIYNTLLDFSVPL